MLLIRLVPNIERVAVFFGSPPPAGSKKLVLKFLSVSSIVMAAASTGRLSNSKKLVIRTLQANKGTLCICIPGARILKIVVMKLIEPNKLLSPEMCSEKIARSTDAPGIPVSDDKGG